MDYKPIIEACDLTKRFGDFTAVDAINFTVAPGEIFGFLGANGAGKTTAMRMLCGLSRPTAGRAEVAGFDVATQSESVKKNIGYMSQKFSLYSQLSLRENLRLFSGIYGLGKAKTRDAIERVADRFDLRREMDMRVGILPPGMRQKLAFAVASVHRPKIIFLDEPTGGVDPITRRLFWETIYKTAAEGTTIFVTTHYMDEAEYCSRVSIMVDGQIRALNSPAELKREFHADSMDQVFRTLARTATRNE